jgi:cyclopropane fatty-acyl-phospholipid synthase-like methyltransferase
MSQRKLFIAYPMVLTLLLGSWSAAETPGADNSDTASVPPVPKTYRGREIAQTMHYLGAPWLIRESREREEQCATLLTALDIKAGDTVCDLGCGNGFYTLKLASLVGDQGTVLAVDIQQEMLGLLRARAESAAILNIRPILSTVDDPHLPTQQVDLLLLVDVYHELSHPAAMLQAIHSSLKPSGRVALVEFRQEDPQVPIKRLHKMSITQILKEFPPAGFKLVGQFERLPWQHVMFFARGDSPLVEIQASPWQE